MLLVLGLSLVPCVVGCVLAQAKMNEDLLQAPCSLLVLASMLVCIVCGYRKVPFGRSVAAGWSLIILAFLYNDFVLPDLASAYLPREAALRISPDTPGTVPAVFLGGMLAAACYYLGKSPPKFRLPTRP
jgi:hypothetical protein